MKTFCQIAGFYWVDSPESEAANESANSQTVKPEGRADNPDLRMHCIYELFFMEDFWHVTVGKSTGGNNYINDGSWEHARLFASTFGVYNGWKPKV